jgi:LuxR family maltose regulon positive regulatory protein
VPFLDIPAAHRVWVAAAFLLGMMARDTLGDPYATGCALQRALDLAGSEQHGADASMISGTALSHSEIRVLRYLPTNLSAREIAGELCISMNTVRTHQRHVYQKLGARSRTQAVEQARSLGLLAPSSRRQ